MRLINHTIKHRITGNPPIRGCNFLNDNCYVTITIIFDDFGGCPLNSADAVRIARSMIGYGVKQLGECPTLHFFAPCLNGFWYILTQSGTRGKAVLQIIHGFRRNSRNNRKFPKIRSNFLVVPHEQLGTRHNPAHQDAHSWDRCNHGTKRMLLGPKYDARSRKYRRHADTDGNGR